jgi:tripartite-type tricarboxylate transporter receptor subunit TctC
VSSAPLCLIVNPQIPARNLKELIELARAKPGTLNFASAGRASTTFLAGALFRKAAGIEIVHVPFKANETVTAVVRGDAQMYLAPLGTAMEMAEAGKVRAIAAATPERIPQMPDVPTFKEAGLDYVYDSWFGLMTQAGVPREIVNKINHDVVAILQRPEVKAKLAAQYLVGAADTPEQFDRIIRAETAHLTKLFAEITD